MRGEMLKLSTQPCPVWSLASFVVGDEARLVSGGDDGLVRIWDPVSSGLPVATFAGHTDGVAAVSCAVDGDAFIASGSFDKTVRLWEPYNCEKKTSYQARILRGHEDLVIAIACKCVDRSFLLASGSRDATVIVWDLDARAPAFKLDHGSHVFDIFIFRQQPQSWCVATASGDRCVRVWDLGRRSCAVLDGHRHAVTAVRALPVSSPQEEDDDLPTIIVSASKDSTLRLWGSSFCIATLTGHTGAVHALECFSTSSGEPRIASGSVDNTVRIWDPRSCLDAFSASSKRQQRRHSNCNNGAVIVIQAHTSAITAMAILPTTAAYRSVKVEDQFPNLVLDDSPGVSLEERKTPGQKNTSN